MRTSITIALLLALVPACDDTCTPATAAAEALGCCSLPTDDLIVTHSPDRAFECDTEERPQVAERCDTSLNDGAAGDDLGSVERPDQRSVGDCGDFAPECAGLADCDVAEGFVLPKPLPIMQKPATARNCLRLDEVFYVGDGAAVLPGFQWIEVTNVCNVEVSAKGVYAQYSQPIYEWVGGFVPVFQLGSLAPGECATIGGPLASSINGWPKYDYVTTIDPVILPGIDAADAIGLFVVGDKAPFDAVIYGSENTRGLVDESGLPGAVDLPTASAGQSMRRTAKGWALGQPQPGACL